MKTLDRLTAKADRHIESARESRPYDPVCGGCFTFGDCIVTFSVSKDLKDFEVSNPVKDRSYDNIAQWLNECTIEYEDVEYEYDEWDEHGFRDEQDYYRWRYC